MAGREQAVGALKVSNAQEATQLDDVAKDWYRRALGVNPAVIEAQQRLTRLTPT